MEFQTRRTFLTKLLAVGIASAAITPAMAQQAPGASSTGASGFGAAGRGGRSSSGYDDPGYYPPRTKRRPLAANGDCGCARAVVVDPSGKMTKRGCNQKPFVNDEFVKWQCERN